jgi:hypothetical protein
MVSMELENVSVVVRPFNDPRGKTSIGRQNSSGRCPVHVGFVEGAYDNVISYQDLLMRIVLCFLILTGCGGRKEADVRIAVGGQGTQVNLPAIVAQELGFYKEVGLNVSLIEFPGGSKALEALMGGSAEVVCGSYDHTIQMAAEGKNLRAFVAMLNFPGMVLVSSNISSIEGLRGKTVGVTTLGSGSHMLLNYLLAMHGMKSNDVSTAAIGSSATAVGAIIHHKIDAAVMTAGAHYCQKTNARIAHSRQHGNSRRSAIRIRNRELSGDRALFEAGVVGGEPRHREEAGERDSAHPDVAAHALSRRDSREIARIVPHGGRPNRRRGVADDTGDAVARREIYP